MPVCQGCGGSFEENISLCPYCGRAKPSPTIINVNVKSPLDSSNCPKAKGVPHRVEMVSGIVRRGGTQLSSVLWLPAPTFPSSAYTWQWILIVYPGICVPLVIGSIPGFLIAGFQLLSSGSSHLSGWNAVPVGILLAVGVIVASIIWFRIFKRKNKTRHDKDEIRNRPLKEHYEKKRMIWNRLFYCYQDDIVFDTETQRFCDPNHLDQYLEEMTHLEPHGLPPLISG